VRQHKDRDASNPESRAMSRRARRAGSCQPALAEDDEHGEDQGTEEHVEDVVDDGHDQEVVPVVPEAPLEVRKNRAAVGRKRSVAAPP